MKRLIVRGLKTASSGFTGAKAFVFMCLMMATGAFAQETTSLMDGLAEKISAIEGELIVIGVALLGISIIYCIYRFAKRMLGGG